MIVGNLMLFSLGGLANWQVGGLASWLVGAQAAEIRVGSGRGVWAGWMGCLNLDRAVMEMV